MFDLAALRDVLEPLSYLAILLGVPVALWQHRRAVHKEQEDREGGTYDALDEKFLEYQRICLDHTDLDIADVAQPLAVELTPEQRRAELIAFTFLMSVFERAFLMYRTQSGVVRRRQWSGWEEYMRDFAGRLNFRAAWEVSGRTFDEDFQTSWPE